MGHFGQCERPHPSRETFLSSIVMQRIGGPWTYGEVQTWTIDFSTTKMQVGYRKVPLINCEFTIRPFGHPFWCRPDSLGPDLWLLTGECSLTNPGLRL